jgi:hypothetical protein
VVDEPGEQVGGSVQDPDAARHRAHLLVPEAVRGLPDGVGGEHRVGVHEHDQLAAPPPDALVLGGPLAGVAVQQADVEALVRPPLVHRRQLLPVA